jgi:ribosomal protein S18 acetylase RimI-like enzyme
MAKLTSRWYRDERDRDRILRLVAAAARHSGPDAGLYHPGDVVWGLFQNCTIDPATRVRLFEDGRGALRGFAWLHGGRDFSIHQDTARPLAARDLVAMIRWVEEHLGPGEPFRTELAPRDELRHGLIAAGYRPTGEATFQLNAQGLDRPIPEPALPAGAAVRPVRFDDPAEVAARVALHREVWEPSKFTAEGYERLRAQPVYRPDLDLVAVTPEGELAAYCIVWWDPVSRSGLFEPVGAAVAHRRRGYATALLRDALRRLHALGAGQAMVVSATGEEKWEPSRRLYASAGFATLFPFEQWERASGAGAAS